MSDASEETLRGTRLAANLASGGNPLSRPAPTFRFANRRGSRNPGGSDSGSDDCLGRDHGNKGGSQMTFWERFSHELSNLWSQILVLPAWIWLPLYGLAVLLLISVALGAR